MESFVGINLVQITNPTKEHEILRDKTGIVVRRLHRSIYEAWVAVNDIPEDYINVWGKGDSRHNHVLFDSDECEQITAISIPFVPIEKFGADHWSTLAYAETRAVDYKGRLDNQHMRCNKLRHPEKQHLVIPHSPKEHPTRLFGYTKESADPLLKIEGHDDWDCLFDASHAGLIYVDYENGIVVFTEKGNKISALLRNHKKAGKSFSTFYYENNDEAQEKAGVK